MDTEGHLYKVKNWNEGTNFRVGRERGKFLRIKKSRGLHLGIRMTYIGWVSSSEGRNQNKTKITRLSPVGATRNVVFRLERKL